MPTKTLIKAIASRIDARRNCLAKIPNAKTGEGLPAVEWFGKHTDWLHAAEKKYLPSGAGIDSGTKIDLDHSTGDRIVFTTSYHHMDQNGMYDGWTEHTVTVRPSFVYGLDIRISGRDRNQIKDYLADVFRECLEQEIPHDDT